jgi:hypothetical protein
VLGRNEAIDLPPQPVFLFSTTNHFRNYQMQIHKDVVTTIRNIRRLADSADQIARSIEGHRVRRESGGPGFASSIEQPHRTHSCPTASGASMMAISHLGQLCRDLHSCYESALAALPDDLQKQIAAA